MTKLWAISRNTFVQTVRQPIYLVLILLTFGLLVLNLPLTGWTMGRSYHDSDQKMLVNVGLSVLLLSGLLIAAFSASGVLAREIEDRTALTVVSKPVPRALFVLGKFVGVGAAVAVAYYLCSLAFLMTVRHRVMPAASDPYDTPVIIMGTSALVLAILAAGAGNLMFNWTFTSAAVSALFVLLSIAMGLIAFIGHEDTWEWVVVPFGEGIDPQILLGMLLIWLAVAVLVAVAVAASTRLGQLTTLLVCLGVLMIGSMYPFLMQRWSGRLVLPYLLAGEFLANLTYFYPLDALSLDMTIPLGYVGRAAVYAAVYIAGVLCLGIAAFQCRPMEAQGTSGTLPGAVGLLGGVGRLAAAVLALVGLEALLGAVWGLLDGGFDPLVHPYLAVLLVAGALLWLLWGHFSRGARWAYWAALGLLGAALVGAVAGMLLADPASEAARFGQATVQALFAALVSAGALIVLALPKTRRHFFATA